MEELVTLEEVKAALRIEEPDDDVILGLYIKAASQAVVLYLKGRASEVIDSSGAQPVVKQATLLLVGIWYKNPDGDPEMMSDRGYLPKPVTSLLYPLRDPALR